MILFAESTNLVFCLPGRSGGEFQANFKRISGKYSLAKRGDRASFLRLDGLFTLVFGHIFVSREHCSLCGWGKLLADRRSQGAELFRAAQSVRVCVLSSVIRWKGFGF